MAWAAVLRTYGDMSDAASLMANIMMGTMMVTLMLDSTRRALARISWLGSWGYNDSQRIIYLESDASIMWLHTAESKGLTGISSFWTLEGIFGPIWHTFATSWVFSEHLAASSLLACSPYYIICAVSLYLKCVSNHNTLETVCQRHIDSILFPHSGNMYLIYGLVFAQTSCSVEQVCNSSLF